SRMENSETAGTAEMKKKDSASPNKKVEPLRIDWEDIQNRIIDMPIKAGNYTRLGVGHEDELLYIENSDKDPDAGTLHKYSITKRKDSEVMDLSDYILSADGK
ncbi:MAG TPA: hypothetical protein VGZ71_15080, partial [Puia sp.]|nr:hypothetical protein [Puia sp.]